MKGYLGEKIVKKEETKYAEYTPKDWALLWILMYGGIEGEHHKNELLDQLVQILTGSEVICKRASWENGHTELRVCLGTATEEYENWVKEYKYGEDGPDTYPYFTEEE